MSKTKSVKPTKYNKQQPIIIEGLRDKDGFECNPTNDQDFEEFARDDSSDSSDYDGVPRIEEIPMINPVEQLDREKMEITLDRNSRGSNDHEMSGVPLTQMVEDSQIVMQTADTDKFSTFSDQRKKIQKSSKSFRRISSTELHTESATLLQLPKAVSFIDKNNMILESIEESPSSKPNLPMTKSKEINFESLMMVQ